MWETLSNVLVAGLILVSAAVATQLFARAMYFHCESCGTLNAKRRRHCRQCGTARPE